MDQWDFWLIAIAIGATIIRLEMQLAAIIRALVEVRATLAAMRPPE